MPRKCRCCEQCSIFTDDFNRADDTDLGANWSEVSGDWEISSNQLKCDDAAALAISTATVPDVYSLHAKLHSNTSGDRLRVVFAYTDTNNYWYVELRYGTNARLVQRSGGSDTTKATTTAIGTLNTRYHVQVCVDVQGSIHVVFGSAAVPWGIDDLHLPFASPASGSVGLGTGSASSTSANFDDFELKKVSPACVKCNGACSHCDDETQIPSAWDIELPTFDLGHMFEACGTACTDLSGQTIRTYYSRQGEVGATHWCVWESPRAANCGGAFDWLNVVFYLRQGDFAGIVVQAQDDQPFLGETNRRLYKENAITSPIDCSTQIEFSGTQFGSSFPWPCYPVSLTQPWYATPVF